MCYDIFEPKHKCATKVAATGENCPEESKYCIDYIQEIYLCEKCYNDYLLNTSDQIKKFLDGRKFEESKGYRLSTVFSNNRFKLYYNKNFERWGIRDITKSTELDICEIRFPFSAEEKTKIMTIIL